MSEAVVSGNGEYSVDYSKLSEDTAKHFDETRLAQMKSAENQTQQEFLADVLDQTYNPVSTKTIVYAVISFVLLLYLVLRAIRQIISLY